MNNGVSGNNVEKKIVFPVNEHGWVLLFRLFGHKTIIRAHKIKDRGRTPDPDNGHRAFELECEGSVKVRPKLYDISQFTI